MLLRICKVADNEYIVCKILNLSNINDWCLEQGVGRFAHVKKKYDLCIVKFDSHAFN